MQVECQQGHEWPLAGAAFGLSLQWGVPRQPAGPVAVPVTPHAVLRPRRGHQAVQEPCAPQQHSTAGSKMP